MARAVQERALPAQWIEEVFQASRQQDGAPAGRCHGLGRWLGCIDHPAQRRHRQAWAQGAQAQRLCPSQRRVQTRLHRPDSQHGYREEKTLKGLALRPRCPCKPKTGRRQPGTAETAVARRKPRSLEGNRVTRNNISDARNNLKIAKEEHEC